MQNHEIPQLMNSLKITLLSLICFTFPAQLGAETNTITTKSSIKDPETITSPGNVFKLGFYSPENTTINRYLAISYVVSEETVVWTANRERPLTDSSGTVTISKDGNLVLIDGNNETIWSTNITTTTNNTSIAATLHDNGNLVVSDNSTGSIVWESFLHPSNVYLPGMVMIDNTITGKRVLLSSWKNESDPGIGIYIGGLEAKKLPQLFTRKNGKPYFRSGPWNGQILIGMAVMYRSVYKAGSTLIEMPKGVFSLTLSRETFLARTSLNTSGVMERKMWNGRSWDFVWAQPENECDIYGTCGPFASCNVGNKPICSCLKGFEPADQDEWDRGNWISGCVRRKPLKCNEASGSEKDGFFKMQFMKVPDFAEPYPSKEIDECTIMCLSNCSCIAYAHDSINIGCMFWRESDGLIDIQQFATFGIDFYIRLERSELDNQRERRELYVIIPVTVGVLVVLLIFIALFCKLVRKGRRIEDRENSKTESVKRASLDSTVSFLRFPSTRPNHQEELESFTFEMLENATNQFHEDNMIGKGGFGHVYKGKLPKGKEIAVKRLSETSNQGTQEFMNEVIVISKLQHKNLVRLLGCCIERDERMLIYEYMPNKSLDICLFDPTGPSMVNLDWKKRFDIIQGIGRGLLYLHRDSRMRIIHRDLKPSNILLDEEWNPKISDFGMARIFGDNQEQGGTARVVGTHGYMAPEYALEGRFSEKSDIYSFGVLMLELVSGKKSTRYYNDDLSLNLLGCAWKFWCEDNCMAFVDQNIASSSSNSGDEEIGRCIHVGLLCVQEYVEDRPTTQVVLSMLNRETLDLPEPKQPLLAKKMDANESSRLQVDSTRLNGWSVNQLTVTVLDGR